MSMSDVPKINVDGNWKVEYYRRQAFNGVYNQYKRAVIAIHGTNRNADDYYRRAKNAVKDLANYDDMLIVAPRFEILNDAYTLRNLSETDRESLSDANRQEAEDYYNNNEIMYWKQGGWKVGHKSVNGNNKSSFFVIDEILNKIQSKFPNIKHVTICGHSAGGQFVQRYAALNEKRERDLGFSIRYVVANPSSYMYLTNERPKSTANCADYDNYRYGMADLPGSLNYTDLTKEQIKTQLLARPVHVMLGSDDNDNNHDNLDTNCEANAQGANRYERGTEYFKHIKKQNIQANHFFSRVDGVGHSSNDMFGSKQGQEALAAEVFVKGSGCGKSIPEHGSQKKGYSEFTVEVSETRAIKSMKVRIDLDHTYVRDLKITLTSPDGTKVALINRVGKELNDFRHTILDDNATKAISAGTAPYTGRFKPSEALSAFTGKSPNGAWTLRIDDEAQQDSGKMNDWSLVIFLE